MGNGTGSPDTPVPVSVIEPWWARAITRWGVGAAIGIYLVYVLVNQVTVQLAKLNDNLTVHMAQQDTVKELLGQVCSNTAKTDDERTFCFDITFRAEKAAEAAAAKAVGSGS